MLGQLQWPGSIQGCLVVVSQLLLRILARVPDPGAKRVLELTVIMRMISIAQVTHGEEGCQHWKPP